MLSSIYFLSISSKNSLSLIIFNKWLIDSKCSTILPIFLIFAFITFIVAWGIFFKFNDFEDASMIEIVILFNLVFDCFNSEI